LTPQLYHLRLLTDLQLRRSITGTIWARPWWTLEDYLGVLRFVDVRDAVVTVKCGLPDVRPNQYSAAQRKWINLAPRFLPRWFTAREVAHAQSGTLRFADGWFGIAVVRVLIDHVLGQLDSKGASQKIILFDEFVADTTKQVVPGLRRQLQEFGALARASAEARRCHRAIAEALTRIVLTAT
jgi:hypothetical protein